VAKIDENAAGGVIRVVAGLATDALTRAGVYWDFDVVGAEEGEGF